jgi:glutamine synthetase
MINLSKNFDELIPRISILEGYRKINIKKAEIDENVYDINKYLENMLTPDERENYKKLLSQLKDEELLYLTEVNIFLNEKGKEIVKMFENIDLEEKYILDNLEKEREIIPNVYDTLETINLNKEQLECIVKLNKKEINDIYNKALPLIRMLNIQ